MGTFPQSRKRNALRSKRTSEQKTASEIENETQIVDEAPVVNSQASNSQNLAIEPHDSEEDIVNYRKLAGKYAEENAALEARIEELERSAKVKYSYCGKAYEASKSNLRHQEQHSKNRESRRIRASPTNPICSRE